jgi:hypothetical protein
LTGGPKVQIAGFCFPEILFVRIAVRKDYTANERKKGPAAPVQALCGTFTPTADLSSEAVLRRMDINFSKLTRFNTRLRL